jgi:hypothetical protein
MRKTKEPETILAWTWEIKIDGEWQLCLWAMPSKEHLIDEGRKPSPEARPVCVRMVRNREVTR